MNNDPILRLLGLCYAGRNLVSGEFAVENAIKQGSAVLVIIATDASDNTKKKFRDSCSFYNTPMYLYGTKDSLGSALGKEERASVAVTQSGLAKSIEEKIRLFEEANGGSK